MKYVAALFALTALATGCVDLEEDAQDTVPVAFIPPDIETQGEHLLGFTIDKLPAAAGRLFSVRLAGLANEVGNTAQSVRFAGDASLVTGNNVPFQGVIRLPATTGTGELLVTWSRNEGTLAFFTLKYRAVVGAGAFAPLCDGAEALPFFHDFTATGRHDHPVLPAVTDRISFACVDGVAAKCTEWGYPAGGKHDLDPRGPWQVHQACTRMGRGDYCASGTPHTNEGTAIAIFDEVVVNSPPPAAFVGVASWPPPPSEFYFEAGWRGEDLPPVCLSKLRWANLPIGGLCPSVLPDPRVTITAQSCDDMIPYVGTLGDSEGKTALQTFADDYDVVLFNASRYNELAMMRWQNGTERVSTIDGYLDPDAGLIKRPYNQNYTPELPAVLDAVLLRAPTADMLPEVVPIALYKNGSDRVYLTDAGLALLPNPGAYTKVGNKGFVFAAESRPGLVPLYVYRKFLGGDATSSTGPGPAGYASKGIMGYTSAPVVPE